MPVTGKLKLAQASAMVGVKTALVCVCNSQAQAIHSRVAA
jgi:hypothetical protein